MAITDNQFDDERRAVESRFLAQWALKAHAAVPVFMEDDGKEPAPGTPAYVRLYLRSGEGQQISLGDNPIDRYAGIVVIQVYVPSGKGTSLARKIAGVAGGIFTRAQFSYGDSGAIRCRTAYLIEQGSKNGWCRVDATVPYIRDAQ